MRIIAGIRRGARFAAPKGTATRPTGDRVREAVFNLVGPVDDASVIDLFAGSGAMGLEALSRGARRCVFVESDRGACAVIRANLEKLQLVGAVCSARTPCRRCERSAGRHARTTSSSSIRRTAPGPLSSHDSRTRCPRCSRADGVMVVETPAKLEPVLPLTVVTSRRYGSARITLFTR